MSAGAQREPVGALVWLGLAVVGTAAAVLSFAALADLAYSSGIESFIPIGDAYRFYLAWLFPLSVDALAAVGTYIWLRRRLVADATVFARRVAWSAIIGTIAGNAYHGYVVAGGGIVATVVSAVPAVAVGAVVHLAVLAGRPAAPPAPTDAARDGEPEWMTAYRLGLDDALAVDWTLALARWRPDEAPAGGVGDEPVEPGGWDPPGRHESNERLASDLRAVDSARRAADLPALARDGIRARYGVGSGRADRVRELVDRADAGGTAGDPPPAGSDGPPAGALNEPGQDDGPATDGALRPAQAAAGGGGRT